MTFWAQAGIMFVQNHYAVISFELVGRDGQRLTSSMIALTITPWCAQARDAKGNVHCRRCRGKKMLYSEKTASGPQRMGCEGDDCQKWHQASLMITTFGLRTDILSCPQSLIANPYNISMIWSCLPCTFPCMSMHMMQRQQVVMMRRPLTCYAFKPFPPKLAMGHISCRQEH